MGNIYNFTHANDIKKQLDNEKRVSGGLLIGLGATIIAHLVYRVKSQKQIRELAERSQALENRTDDLFDFNTNIPTGTSTEPTIQIDAPDFSEVASEVKEVISGVVEDVKDNVEETKEVVEDVVEEATEVVEDVVDNAKDAVEETVEKVKTGVFEEVKNLVDVTVDTKPLDEAEKKVAASKKKGGKK